jgi:tetratricopeptide (TPR) repeat protein
VLAAAAVLGADIDFAVLQRAAGLDERAAAEGLEELVRRRTLVHAGGAFAFDHDQIRQVAYDRLLPDHRRVLHRAAGEALETVHAGRLDDVSDRLAHHFGQAGTPDKAVAYLGRFAAAARRRYALDAAVQALDEALGHVDALPPQERLRRRLDVLLRQAFILSLQTRFLDILARLLPYREEVERLGDPALTGPYFFRLGLTSTVLGLHEDGRRFAEWAREAAALVDDRVTLGRAFYVLAACDFAEGYGRDGVVHGQEAVACLQETTERLALGQAHWIVGLSHHLLGQFDAAIEAGARMRAVADETGDAGLEALGAVATAWTHLARGAYDAAVADAERARDRSPNPPTTALAAGMAAYGRLARGENIDAVAPLARSVALEGRHNRRVLVGVLLADACLQGGDLARARAAAEECRTLAEQVRFTWGRAAGERALGRIAAAAGAPSEAETLLRSALAVFDAMPAPFDAAVTRLDLAAVRRAGGDVAAARTLADEAGKAFAALGLSDWTERAARIG